MQIRYHFALTKIQKLQNFKNNNKKLFSVPIGTPGIARNWPVWPVFFLVRNKRVICTGLLTGTVYTGRTGRYGMESTSLITTTPCVRNRYPPQTPNKMFNIFHDIPQQRYVGFLQWNSLHYISIVSLKNQSGKTCVNSKFNSLSMSCILQVKVL